MRFNPPAAGRSSFCRANQSRDCRLDVRRQRRPRLGHGGEVGVGGFIGRSMGDGVLGVARKCKAWRRLRFRALCTQSRRSAKLSYTPRSVVILLPAAVNAAAC